MTVYRATPLTFQRKRPEVRGSLSRNFKRPMTDHRLYAPATSRNRDPILKVLRTVLPAKGAVLEVASGSGDHIVHFARHLPHLTFQPTDRSSEALASISAWVEAACVDNVRPPLFLDASASLWPIPVADAIICINMVHISPWRATIGLISRAAAILPPGAPLYLYGPFKVKGVHTARSNQEFDRGLHDSDPAWGVRDVAAVAALARSAGFSEPIITDMPANNLSVVFRRIQPDSGASS